MTSLRGKQWLLLLAALPALAAASFVIWASAVPAPMDEALGALQPDGEVSVETEPWLVFRPQGTTPEVGLIFYPGGRIDPRAYAPAARAVAEAGYLVVIPPMPLNLAVLSPDRASEIQAAFPEVRRWAVGGHSLGGAMAAQYAARHPGAAQGVVLWGAYPPSSASLAESPLAVASIFGTNDGLATPAKILASHSLLPPTTTWVEIDGGNHAQFGWYGPQTGDGLASVSRAEQQSQAVQATIALLRSLAPGP